MTKACNTNGAGAPDSMLILGSTGSIGKQTLDVAKRLNIRVDAICAHRDVASVEAQAREYKVRACAMGDESAAAELRTRLADTNVLVYGGSQGITQMIADSHAPLALNAIIGQAGLASTLTVLHEGKQLALANKESLVVAGQIVMDLARRKGIKVRPVDSEHCAIAQCLGCGEMSEVNRLILTASGGPFFGKKRADLGMVSARDALAHPTWSMGAKITIDSASMMNKGFEIIEACHLFELPADRVDVVVHRESIIHSMVEYIDRSIIAQLAVPDMRLCIQHALTNEKREQGCIEPLDLVKVGTLSFAEPDAETFVLLNLAKVAMKRGGASTAVLNAANEVAVEAFLQDRIGFLKLFDVVCETVERLPLAAQAVALDDILAYDSRAREIASELL